MTDIIVRKVNDVNMFIETDASTAHSIQDFFTYKADGYKFHPKFKAKIWNGDIHLFGAFKRTLYIGLLWHLQEFARLNEYSIEIDPKLTEKTDITPQSLGKYVETLDLSAHGKPIKPRNFQYLAIYKSILEKRKTVVLPTSAGKSLNLYVTTRWFSDHRNKKALIIVPTIALVSQMYSDFDDYSSLSSWSAEDNIHCISGGTDKDADKAIYISTWQSLMKQSPKWFSQFGLIYNDECHNGKSTAIKGIMEKTLDCEFKFGTTGTTGGKKVNDLLIQGVFGKIEKFVTTKQLMDRNQVAQLTIKCVSFLYPEIERKECRNMDYQEEIAWLTKHNRRNSAIINSIADMPGNQLVLANKVSHVEDLYERAKRKYPERNIYIIHGKVDKEEREKIRIAVDKDDKSTIFATYGTMSTGVSIRNLNHVIFASGSKSMIRVLQSLGRVLRLSETKSTAILWDIFDDLSIKKHKNFTLKHFIERFKIYTAEKFTMENLKVTI